ncbi:DUF2384 domain-containing protein [Methylonatrum kenyense]|uniref:antitoxin Xre/MbcA/ParS toxin-binding domain-containing protein n=1 Tax=Methylonatrum kenyense TaxID=455253 RepID=UPI0020C01EC2|nr:antitoxin Xre/MbcA/ParS toxin-binding domain-containing protein [Methylonatrum kenyense]MCK8515007.1 DUF2384 domain-containing protein [Methylonatrum kenyense]
MIQGSEIQQMAAVLGLDDIRGGYTGFAFSQRIADGLPLRAIEHVHRVVAPGSRDFSTLVIPKQTLLRRRRKRESLNRNESERLARIARVWAMAIDVYRDEGMARTFLTRPHPMLDGRVPLDVAIVTGYGAEAVVEILGRLKYGSAA